MEKKPAPRIITPNAKHLYELGTDKGPLFVEANTRTSAAAKARAAGYVVHDVNMVG